jgi:hypothetical protein
MEKHRSKVRPRREASVRLAINVTVVFYGCLAVYLATCFLLDLFDQELQTLAGRPRLAGAIIAVITVSLVALVLAVVRIWPIARHMAVSAITYLGKDDEE